MLVYALIVTAVLALGIALGFLWGRGKKKKTVFEQLISGLSLEQKFFLAFALLATSFIITALKTDFTGAAGPYKFSLLLATLLLLFIGFVFVPRIRERKAARAVITSKRRGP